MKIQESIMSGSEYIPGVGRKTFCLRYRWVKTDSGRSNSKRSKQSNDCTVRAIALAYQMEYDQAYDLLAEAGRKCSKGFDLVSFLNKRGHEKLSFQAIKGQRRMNPSQFCMDYPSGVYICRVAKHVFTVIDGVVYDTFENRPDRCIYTAWKIA